MFRTKISSFWKKYKQKIIYVFKRFVIAIIISVSMAAVLSQISKNDGNTTNSKDIYSPSSTVISGSDISKEEFEKDNNLVSTFIQYCNEKKIEDAYNLLTNECKEKVYPTLESFEKRYYNLIFEGEREYNLKSWINDENFNTYRARFVEDLMATGNYNEAKKYEDYITIVSDKNNNDNKKLNINGYIKTEYIYGNSQVEGLEIEVTSVDIYMDYVIYNIRTKNTTSSKILLDPLENYRSIKLGGTNEATYRLNNINLSTIDLTINANEKKEISLRFNKKHGSEVKGNSIQFEKVITNYSEYIRNKESYEKFKKIIIEF